MLIKFTVCFLAGIGAGLGTGFAGMSAAAVISPMLISFLDIPAYEAVGIALASDVLASAVSAYTYGKNKNLDIKKTIRYNLKNYDIKNKTIFTDKLFFNQNIKKYNPYNIIILIDESGSMLDSVIYSSIMASIFANLPYLSIKLVIFDISVVDLSEHIKEPIDILFKVQLGGGTNIAQALEYAKKITFAPDKTIVLLISDLFDSNDYKLMYKNANDIIEAGSKLIVLTALDYNANSIYDKEAARYFSKIGAKVGALTPSKLSKWISDIIS